MHGKGARMTRLRTAVSAIAVAAAIFTASTLYAGPATAATTTACSTWQYVTDPGMPIYFGAGTGTGRKDTTRNQGFVNVTGFSGNWRGGNFYTDPGPVWYTSGWIYVGHIHYVRCW